MHEEFKPLEMAKKSETFCILPWIHQYVGPLGEVTPCCVFTHQQAFLNNAEPLGDLKENTLEEVWNNEETKQLRLKFLNGEIDERCYFCNIRRNTGSPFYDEFNRDYLELNEVKDIIKNTKPDGTVENHKLFYIDVRWNNLCNFKCRMCSPHYSTSWIDDHRQLYGHAKATHSFMFSGKTEDDLLEQIMTHCETATMIYFAGGEPLIQKEHYEVLLRLLELGRTDVMIRYNTNFSQLKLKNYDNVLEYWKQFKNIEIGASIDGSYERAEYWRHGTKWNQIVENAKNLKEQVPQATLKLSYTLSWVNAHNLIDLHKEWLKLGFIGFEDLRINCLSTPPYYSLKSIPLWKKQEIEKMFNEYILWGKKTAPLEYYYFETIVKNAIDFMYDTNEQDDPEIHMREFMRITKKLDNIRGEDFFSVFPEHLDIKEAYGNDS